MNRIILILIWIGTMINTYSQSTLLWSKNYTTGLNNYYSEHPIIQTVADTIKVSGRKNTDNGQRLVIVKYDLFGDTISTKTYGNDSVNNNEIIDYKFDTLNHVYILNREQLGLYKSKIVLQKYSLEGNLIWIAQVQSPADTSYTPRSLGIANDTCIFLSAFKEFDYPAQIDDVFSTITRYQLYAFNAVGDLKWKREFNPNTEINWFAHDIFIHSNEIFIFGSNGKLVKIDFDNNLTFNGNTDILNGINNIQVTPDNNLLITAGARYRISKVNLNGSLIWTRQYGTNLPSNTGGDEIKATVQDAVGNIYLTGRHYGMNYGTPSYTNADVLTLKYDENGTLIWQNRFQYDINNADIGNTITLKNGQVYVGGESQRLGIATDYDYLVLKIDASTGLSTGNYRYDGILNGDDVISSLYIFDNGNVALTGLSYINDQYNWTTQLLSDVVLSVPNISLDNNFQVYPNPIVNGEVLTIVGNNGIQSYSIISTFGQIIQQGIIETNELNAVSIDTISSGIYLMTIQTDKGIVTRKLMVK
jgi:hypothetical protein